MTTLAERLKDLRTRIGLSQTALSLEAGLSKNVVQLIESGETKSPSVANAQALAKRLGVSIGYLTEGEARNEPAPGFAESSVRSWELPRHQGQRPDLIDSTQRLIRTLAPAARTPSTFRLGRSHPSFALLDGDILIIDQGTKPATGDLVVAQVVDFQTGTGATGLRRYFPPYLLPDSVSASDEVLLADGQRTSVMGPVVASFRASQIATGPISDPNEQHS